MTVPDLAIDNSGEKQEPEGRFLVAVGAMIEHVPTGQILLLRRAETVAWLPGVWEDIAGRMKQFEQPEHALRREVYEENGREPEKKRLLPEQGTWVLRGPTGPTGPARAPQTAAHGRFCGVVRRCCRLAHSGIAPRPGSLPGGGLQAVFPGGAGIRWRLDRH
jgi:NUDIX domain